ncbi:hypothetical protein [Pseudooceanicola sp. HF7]|uniref:hypothetical protein n=1 Tax=Pseudooceanicola sp. HF7 TaxID=2721560 RepID=UPI0034C683A8
MTDYRKLAGASMKSIVDWFGCLDAAAECIAARWDGRANKATVSKKLSGLLDWTIADVIALEDARGAFPVTRLLARRLNEREQAVAGSLLADGGEIAKECGEAIAAILAAHHSSSADDIARACAELREAMEPQRRALCRLEAMLTDRRAHHGVEVPE